MENIAIVEIGSKVQYSYEISSRSNSTIHIYYYDEDISYGELQKEIEDLKDWYSIVIYPTHQEE